MRLCEKGPSSNYANLLMHVRRILILLLVLPALSYVSASASDTLDLDEYSGKVVVVDFWASWCVPCRRSFPWLNSMHDTYADQGLVIVGVNLDNEEDAARKFLEEYPPKFKIAFDSNKEMAREFDVIAMPSSFVIGRDGAIVATHHGFKVKRQDEYEAVIRKALAED